MIEYDKFQKSLKHLETLYQNYTTMDEGFPEWVKESVPESVIQRFETCFDCTWKTLKRYLNEEVGIAQTPNGPKPLFRMANENNLLEAGAEPWIKYINARNSTSHDYSGEKATDALAMMSDFIKDAISLYEKLSGEKWQ